MLPALHLATSALRLGSGTLDKAAARPDTSHPSPNPPAPVDGSGTRAPGPASPRLPLTVTTATTANSGGRPAPLAAPTVARLPLLSLPAATTAPAPGTGTLDRAAAFPSTPLLPSPPAPTTGSGTRTPSAASLSRLPLPRPSLLTTRAPPPRSATAPCSNTGGLKLSRSCAGRVLRFTSTRLPASFSKPWTFSPLVFFTNSSLVFAVFAPVGRAILESRFTRLFFSDYLLFTS